jgi:hypothetical protein
MRAERFPGLNANALCPGKPPLRKPKSVVPRPQRLIVVLLPFATRLS